MKRILAILLTVAVLTSCGAARVVERIRYQHDTLFVNHLQVDSIFRRDSIFIREKNDTVYHYIERIRDRYRFIHDTTYISRVDTVSVIETKEVKVEKPLTRWQRFRVGFGTWSMVAALLGMVYLAVKRKWWVKIIGFIRKFL